NEEVEPRQNIAEHVLVDPGMSRVGGDDPEPFDLFAQDSFDDLVVGPTRSVGNESRINAKDASDFLAMIGIGEVVPAEQVGCIAEQPRTHRIALAGDGVCTRAWSANVARQKGQIDNGLSRADTFVALVDAHRPPE